MSTEKSINLKLRALSRTLLAFDMPKGAAIAFDGADALVEADAKNAQHWIARVKDSINGYEEVQTAYFDGTQAGAALYFRNCAPIVRYIGDNRYQVIMAANPIVLQDSES